MHVLLCMYAKKVDKYQLTSLQELKICYCLIKTVRTDKKIDHQTQPTVYSVGYAESHLVIL